VLFIEPFVYISSIVIIDGHVDLEGLAHSTGSSILINGGGTVKPSSGPVSPISGAHALKHMLWEGRLIAGPIDIVSSATA
jgi:hypothetical protein